MMMGCILRTMGLSARRTARTFFTFLGIMPRGSGEEDIATFLALGAGCDLLALRGSCLRST